MVIIYTVCASVEEAESIASALLEARLIACANWWPTQSLYRWKGKVENGREVALFLKTDEAHAEACEQTVKELHSYEVPCIARIPIEAMSEPYRQWLEGELTT